MNKVTIKYLTIVIVLLAGCSSNNPQAPTNPGQNNSTPIAQTNANRQIKLDTFIVPTPTPLPPTPPPPITPNPTGQCSAHIWANSCSQCCAGLCMSSQNGAAANYLIAVAPGAVPTYNGEPYWCDAKPVIYLYPQEPTITSVKVEVPGTIPISDPLYPPEGWQNILAMPSGDLFYQGRKYKELFYEAAITPSNRPTTGIIVPYEAITQTLLSTAQQLGFNTYESLEFTLFWAPRLQALKSPYILVSVFDPLAKQVIDKVTITPKPDVFIEYIFYFKPLSKPVEIAPLLLPTQPVARYGFTAVEWGGIIDTE